MILIIMFIFFSFSALAATSASAATAINSNVTADFSATPVSGVAPLTVQFKDNSVGSITAWEWSFGDGASSMYSKKTDPTHIYTSEGIYTVTLTVRNQAQSSQKTGTISVTAQKPVAAFSASPTSGNSPLTVSFTDKSTGSPASWSWNFGDGTYSTIQNPTHIYYGVGTYAVSLTVTNTAGSSVSSSTINVSSAPAIVADFNSNVTSGKVPLKVQFNDLSTGNPTTWNWDFGDGTNSTIKNPIHTYQAIGTYTVTLRAGSGTTMGVITKTNYITVGDGLQAVFTAYPNQGVAPLTVQFNDTSIGSPIAWLWDFGDGSNSTLKNPVHIYTQAGSYAVRLTVSNNIETNTSQVPFLVNVSSINTPVVDFNSNLTLGNVPLTVQFNDLSTGDPTAWEWDFNSDGQVDSNEKNPVYEFMYPGSYTITLRAGNSTWNNYTTKINYITVRAVFQAGFTASPEQGDAPLTVQFTDTSTGNVTSWFWDFGDGSNSTSQNPIHTYSGPGSYTVTLNVSNDMNESRSLTLPGYITVTQGSESSSSGGGGSSSSGTGSLAGTGGSPEPASNIAAKLQTQKYITAGNHIKFEFTKNATCVDFVEFDAKKTLGKTTTTIEQLKGRSVLTATDPAGKIYKYFNIWVGNNGIAIPENIGNATVEFIISKAEIKLNETEKSAIILQRYEQGKWNPLKTTKIGEDDQYIYYQANTTSFSSFAITSGKPIEESYPNEADLSQPVQENLSQPKNPYNDQLSIQSKQPGKNDTMSNMDWHKYSGIIRFFVLFIVVLFVGLVIREKRK